MSESAATETVALARDLVGYDAVSQLRQAQDINWVLSMAPRPPQRIVDLGCGTGALLMAALDRWSIKRALGIDGSPGRVQESRKRLGMRADVKLGDLRELPGHAETFDLITMTSVLHWLYPDEDRSLAWIAAHLATDGAFLVTTHHPDIDSSGRGGEDVVAAEALTMIGAAPDRLDRVVPMGLRARPVDAVRAILNQQFVIDAVENRRVSVRTPDAEQYCRFHIATFGTYFSRVVPDRQEDYFRAVGAVAARRMAEHGEVYGVNVCAWRAVHADSASELNTMPST
ncbi:class I SAM-dependent methyltransferase [Nocardia sp. NPDC060256]|uniref:class I SAM-dependent methyltransferase n=1 Tax=unclassified Nocardia TaxID=2637762 RepID=UPI0036650C7A